MDSEQVTVTVTPGEELALSLIARDRASAIQAAELAFSQQASLALAPYLQPGQKLVGLERTGERTIRLTVSPAAPLKEQGSTSTKNQNAQQQDQESN